MNKPLIQFAYRQLIDSSSKGEFESNVFNDTHAEFLMQIQSWQVDPSYVSWKDFKENIEDLEEKINFKVGMAIGGYLSELYHEIPNLADAHSKPLLFENYKFEIVDTSIKSRSVHRIALTYFTGTYTLLESIGDSLLLKDGVFNAQAGPVDTILLKLVPGLSIVSYALPL